MFARLIAKMLATTALAAALAAAARAGERTLIDSQWRFQLGDDPAWSAADVADQSWRRVDLPHDWSIEGERAAEAPGGGALGYFPAGVGWYRRTFDVPREWQDRRVAITFDGVYRDAEVWCNGAPAGVRFNGFMPLRCDLTEHLKWGEQNTIAVRVDNSAVPNARWYTGSGIYRHVWLSVEPQVHLVADGVVARTRRTQAGSVEVAIDAEVVNQSSAAAVVGLEVELTDSTGARTTGSIPVRTFAPGESQTLAIVLAVEHPRLWSPEDPELSRLSVRTVGDGAAQQAGDECRLNIGLRTVEVDAANGLLLNGEPIQLCGGNVHSDLGPLGAAPFDGAEQRRVKLLKAAGFNALRTAHNPPAPAFLDACDRLGMLVIDEAFDEWEASKTPHDGGDSFARRWPDDVAALVRRDRNHPSVIMWSIGNEMYERGKPRGVELAAAIAERVHQLDPTRPVTAAVNGLGPDRDWTELDPLFAALDVAGYNYELSRVAADHERVPNRLIYGSETFPSEAFADWQTTVSHPFVLGACVWSAADYLGEAGIGRTFAADESVLPHWQGNHFPWHGGACGDLDLIGRRRPHSHYRNIVWDRGEKLFAAVQVPSEGGPWNLSQWSPPPLADHWTWPGREGESLSVEVFSRYDAVRVLLNGQLIGEQPTTRDQQFRAVFEAPYQPGVLSVIGLRDGDEAERFELTTTGPPARIQLTPESVDVAADRQSLAFINVAIVDEHGRTCPHAAGPVAYTVTGPAEIAAIGSGNLASAESYRANPRRVDQGRALVVLRSTGEPGEIVVRAKAEGLPTASATLTAK